MRAGTHLRLPDGWDYGQRPEIYRASWDPEYRKRLEAELDEYYRPKQHQSKKPGRLSRFIRWFFK